MVDPERMHKIANWSRQLSEPEFERARTAIREKRFSQGAIICEEGREFDYWAGVVDGLLKLRSLSAGGKDVSLTGVHAGGWFGEGSVLKGVARQYDVVALRDTTVALLDRKTFLWLFENSAAFSRFLVGQLNERLGYFIGMVENDRKLDPTARVARTLASMMNPILFPDVGRHLMITQEEMGLLAGVSRPIANQALKKLERDGILLWEYAGVTVLNFDKLQAYNG
jgi:CRP-like cAMP-binding protein